MNKNSTIVTIVVVLIVGLAAFFGGMQYQKMQRPSFSNGQSVLGNGQARRFGGGQNGGFRPVAGEILSTDDKSITVKLMDGSSKIIILSDKTSINKSSQGVKSDLKTGEHVAVFGSENSDGSVTAQNVQLNPMMKGFRNGPTPSK